MSSRTRGAIFTFSLAPLSDDFQEPLVRLLREKLFKLKPILAVICPASFLFSFPLRDRRKGVGSALITINFGTFLIGNSYFLRRTENDRGRSKGMPSCGARSSTLWHGADLGRYTLRSTVRVLLGAGCSRSTTRRSAGRSTEGAVHAYRAKSAVGRWASEIGRNFFIDLLRSQSLKDACLPACACLWRRMSERPSHLWAPTA